jgi:hypothetical protein
VVRESAPSMTPEEKVIAMLVGVLRVGGEGDGEGGWYIEVPRLGRGLARFGGGDGEEVLDFSFLEVVHVDVDAICEERSAMRG